MNVIYSWKICIDICGMGYAQMNGTYNKKLSLKKNLSHFIGFKKSSQNK